MHGACRKLLIGSISVSYVMGVLTALCFANPWMAFAGAFGFCGIIYISLRIYDRFKEKYLTHKRVLTVQTITGYELNPEDIHEAVEKLGYYEHEMEV